MKTKQFKLGPMDNFSYAVWDEAAREAAVIDPAWRPEVVEKFLLKEGLTLKLLLLTHAHPDHMNAAAHFLKMNASTALTVHKDDAFMLEPGLGPLNLLSGGEELPIGGHKISVIHTPGHTPGSVCYLADGSLFTGDTLFVGVCGRVDLPRSDPAALRLSLLKLAALPDRTVMYPGHSYNGCESTIGAQKASNIYVRLAAKSEAEFIKAAAT